MIFLTYLSINGANRRIVCKQISSYPHLMIKNVAKLVEGTILVLAPSYPINGSLENAVVYIYIGSGLVEHPQHKRSQPMVQTTTGTWMIMNGHCLRQRRLYSFSSKLLYRNRELSPFVQLCICAWFCLNHDTANSDMKPHQGKQPTP